MYLTLISTPPSLSLSLYNTSVCLCLSIARLSDNLAFSNDWVFSVAWCKPQIYSILLSVMWLNFDRISKRFHCIKTEKSNKQYRIKHVWANIVFFGVRLLTHFFVYFLACFIGLENSAFPTWFNKMEWTAKKNHTLTKRNYDTFLIRAGGFFSLSVFS